MATKLTAWTFPTTVTPKNIPLPSAGNRDYGIWYNTNNLKTSDSNFACIYVSSSSGSYAKPPNLSSKDYRFNIPTCADIVKVIVADIHRNVTASSETAYPKVVNVTHHLMNGNNQISSHINKTYYKEANRSDYEFKVPNLTPNIVNSANFGLKVEFSKNNNYNNGRFDFKYLPIRVEYSIPEYKVGSRILGETTTYKMGDEVEIELNLQNLNKTKHNPNININLPDGVEFLEKTGGQGDLTITSENNLKWNSKLNNEVAKQTVTFKLKLSGYGAKTIKTDVSTTDGLVKVSDTLNFEIIGETLKVELNPILPTKTEINTDYPFKINFNTPISFDTRNYSIHVLLYYNNNRFIRIEDYLEVKDSKGGTITPNDGYIIKPDLSETNMGYFNFNFNSKVQGKFEVRVSIVKEDEGVIEELPVNTSLCIDKNASDGLFYQLSDEQRSRLGEWVNYQISTYISCSNPSKIIDTGYNYRLSVFNDDTEGITGDKELMEFFKNSDNLIQAQTEEPTVLTTDYTEQTVNFNYNPEYPVYILLYCDYGSLTEAEIKFTSFTLMETEEIEDNNPKCDFPPSNQIIGAEYDLEAQEYTNALRLYDFEFIDSENYLIQGIMSRFLLNFTSNDNKLVLFGELTDNDSWEYYKTESVVYDDTNSDMEERENKYLELGEPVSKWGLSTEARQTDKLNDYNFDLYFKNLSNNPLSFIIDDFQFLITIIQSKEDRFKVFINDDDLSQYGVNIETVKLPFGVKTDNKYADELTTDTHNPYLMIIDKNEIELKFSIEGCDLAETTQLLNQVAKLFYNKRDGMNTPIINTISFSFLPDKVFHFVTEDSIDSELEISNYDCSIKLILVDGAYESKYPKVTGYTGTNEGISNVRPLIILNNLSPNVENDTSFSFELYEEISNTSVIINDFSSEITEDELKSSRLYIDSDDRTVTLVTNDIIEDTSEIIEDDTIDLTEFVDLSSDWFNIPKEYLFSVYDNNADIESVSFFERGN